MDLVEDHEEKGGFPQGGGASSIHTLFIVRTMESYPSCPVPYARLRGVKIGQA
jgi:hypothetical protein